MNHPKSNFLVYQLPNVPEALYVNDIGPWDKFMSVTNNAERVVEYLASKKIWKPGMRLFYYDSENKLDEILVLDGKFKGFFPGPDKGECWNCEENTEPHYEFCCHCGAKLGMK